MGSSHKSPPPTLFIQLFTKHQYALNAFISSLVPRREDIDDVMQETSLALWRKWADYDVSRDFFRWACGIAHIEVLRHHRKKATDRLWFNEELIEVLAFEMLEDTALFELRRNALDSCLKKLRESDRTVIELRYQAGMTVEKVAELLGRTTRTVHRTMARIRRALHNCISVSIQQVRGLRI